ncbi:MAG: sporulation protein YhbH [Candidatus Levybacteria bacterium RIFCSPHIGHO2_01_FULL_36_15]|nr:MAG: sporulation protein YhbH [Candidatus Levybacteria bacterium RIFCSPHIGHO2_01_FULL_36_15]OGH37804.1 MAG: sporulation protein YhbH [Candidatus Levybacteria bacterium RIFCSPLOWO2_01_FULL_36_10]
MGTGHETITLSKQDWSLHRKGHADAARHDEKVKEAIKGNLPRIISEEAIITSDGKKIVKVPMRRLELPRFRYDFGKNKHIGQGDGDSQPGDSVGQDVSGRGRQAGDQPGIDYEEVDITIDDLAKLVFEDLELPNLQQKQAREMESESVIFDDVRKKGLWANLDKRKTFQANMKRNAMQTGQVRFGGVKDDDYRFRTWNRKPEPKTNAAVIAMRDVSGSMGEFEKYITRSFYFWMVRFLRERYNKVDIRFLTHHTEAQEVDEQKFFKLGESGGTKVSSAYQLALDIINRDYPSHDWNTYPFHFSDGDNWGNVDNRRCVDLIKQIIDRSNLFGYGEIRQGAIRSSSVLMNSFQAIKDKRFTPVVITDKKDVFPALKQFFRARPDLEGALDRR